MKKLVATIVLVTVLTTTILLVRHNSDRLPSSLPNTIALSNNGIEWGDGPVTNETKKQMKSMILSSWDWHFKLNILYISFENLQLNAYTGVKTLCEVYPHMVLVLEAPDISYSGEFPEISINQNCQTESGKRQVISAYDFNFLNDANALKEIKTASSALSNHAIQIKNWEDGVPHHWRVQKLIFFPADERQDDPITLQKYEILSRIGHSVEFETSLQKQ